MSLVIHLTMAEDVYRSVQGLHERSLIGNALPGAVKGRTVGR